MKTVQGEATQMTSEQTVTVDTKKLEGFIKAFGNVELPFDFITCDCGKLYYNYAEAAHYDGDRQKLEESGISIDYPMPLIKFHGKSYAEPCACWHGKAAILMHTLDSHAHSIARYLRWQKTLKQDIADQAPVV